ncbi:MAG TPA: MlaD family protein [Tepidisphaeraceae bacterium]|jgi:ABC-type transporter Mla subunit MlaD|nr:MlaD family protein [Tepidisphaeraceae bacterium]
MIKRRNALRAGIFIVLSIVLAITIVIGIKGLDRILDPVDKRTVRFTLQDDLGGLRVGDDVRIGGYKVGQVRDIDVVPPSDPRLARSSASTPSTAPITQPMILVTFGVPKKYDIKEGARIGIQGTVTGQSWLNFDSLGSGPSLGPEIALVGRPSGINALMASLTDISPRINNIITQVDQQTIPTVNLTVASYKTTAETGTKLLNEVREYTKPVIDKYHAVADSTKVMMTNVGEMFGESKTDFKGTVKNLNDTTAALKEKLPAIIEKVNGVMVKVDDSVTKAREALDDVKKAVASTREMTASANSVLTGNQGRINGMIASLKATSDNLKGASAEIRRSPWRLLYTPKKGEMANLNIYDSARQFAEGANDLNDAAQALRDALKDKSAQPDQIRQLMDKVEKSFGKFNEVEQKLWAEVKE